MRIVDGMARLRQLCSNEFLDTLADWNTVLKDTSLGNGAGCEPARTEDSNDAANDDGARKGPVNRISQRRQRL
jgi:hypothetical protein